MPYGDMKLTNIAKENYDLKQNSKICY